MNEKFYQDRYQWSVEYMDSLEVLHREVERLQSNKDVSVTQSKITTNAMLMLMVGEAQVGGNDLHYLYVCNHVKWADYVRETLNKILLREFIMTKVEGNTINVFNKNQLFTIISSSEIMLNTDNKYVLVYVDVDEKTFEKRKEQFDYLLEMLDDDSWIVG